MQQTIVVRIYRPRLAFPLHITTLPSVNSLPFADCLLSSRCMCLEPPFDPISTFRLSSASIGDNRPNNPYAFRVRFFFLLLLFRVCVLS